MPTRVAKRSRNTKETQIAIELNIDGTGMCNIDTGVPFFNHMLNQLGKHGGMDLDIQATGDLEIDTHHTIEDTGILLGEVFRQALGNKAGVRRFASISVPLDEARTDVTLDLSGRPFLTYEVELPWGAPLGTPAFDPQLAEEFWRGFVMASGITLHIRNNTGKNLHHIIESSFKGVARAIKDAVRVEGGGVPSTKGTLSAEEDQNDPNSEINLSEGPALSSIPGAKNAKNNAKIEVVAFDFNGTLLADVDTYVSINVEFARRLGLKGLTSERYRQLAGTPGADWTYAFRVVAQEEENDFVLGLPKEMTPGLKTSQTMEDLYQEVYEQRMKEQWARWERDPASLLANDALDVIKSLRNEGVKIAVISTQYNAQVEPLLELSGALKGIGVDNIYGGVSSKAEMMRVIAANEGLKVGSVLYVGDERKDLAHAAEAGARFAHMANGVNPRARVAQDAKQLNQNIRLLDGFGQIIDLVADVNAKAAIEAKEKPALVRVAS